MILPPPMPAELETSDDAETLPMIPLSAAAPRHFVDTVAPPARRRAAPKSYHPELL